MMMPAEAKSKNPDLTFLMTTASINQIIDAKKKQNWMRVCRQTATTKTSQWQQLVAPLGVVVNSYSVILSQLIVAGFSATVVLPQNTTTSQQY